MTNSIANNWAKGVPLFSQINVAAGPVTLTFGNGPLLQPFPNLSLIANFANYITSGFKATWGFTTSGAIWSDGGYLFGNFADHNFSSGVLGWLNHITGSVHLGNILGAVADPSLGPSNDGLPPFEMNDAW